MIISAAQNATKIETLTKAVSSYLTAGAKFSKVIIAICQLPDGIKTIEEKTEFCEEIAQVLTTARQQGAAKMEKVSKEFTNAWGYAGRIAGAQLGVKFTYQQHAGFYKVEPIAAPAAKDPVTTGTETDSSGADRLAANEAAGTTENAKLPKLPSARNKSEQATAARAARLEVARQALNGLLKMGLTLDEIAQVYEEKAMELAEVAATIETLEKVAA